MSVDKSESVFSRWSRRKLEARAQEENPEDSVELAKLEAAPDSEIAEAPAEPEAPPLTDADMPDIETLTAESDFSPFMSPGVSEELRKLALRKLFSASVFNIRDGLDEYDDDFTTFEKLGDIVTSDMKHRLEMEQKKLQEKLDVEESIDDDGMEDIEDLDEEEGEAELQVASATEADTESLEMQHNAEKQPEESTDERR